MRHSRAHILVINKISENDENLCIPRSELDFVLAMQEERVIGSTIKRSDVFLNGREENLVTLTNVIKHCKRLRRMSSRGSWGGRKDVAEQEGTKYVCTTQETAEHTDTLAVYLKWKQNQNQKFGGLHSSGVRLNTEGNIIRCMSAICSYFKKYYRRNLYHHSYCGLMRYDKIPRLA